MHGGGRTTRPGDARLDNRPPVAVVLAWLLIVGVLAAATGCAGPQAVPATFADLPDQRDVVMTLESATELRVEMDTPSGAEATTERAAQNRVLRVRDDRDADGRRTTRVEYLAHDSTSPGTSFQLRMSNDALHVLDADGAPVSPVARAQVLTDLLLASEWFVPARTLAGRTLQPGDRVELPVSDRDAGDAMPGTIQRPAWSSRVLTYRGLRVEKADGGGRDHAPGIRWAVFDVAMTGRLDLASIDENATVSGLQLRGPVTVRGTVDVRLDDPAIIRGTVEGDLRLAGTGAIRGESFTCKANGRVRHSCRVTDETDAATRASAGSEDADHTE